MKQYITIARPRYAFVKPQCPLTVIKQHIYIYIMTCGELLLLYHSHQVWKHGSNADTLRSFKFIFHLNQSVSQILFMRQLSNESNAIESALQFNEKQTTTMKIK